MKVDELIGSLQTYEMILPSPKRPKAIALKASSKEKVESKDESVQILIQSKFSKFTKKKLKSL